MIGAFHPDYQTNLPLPLAQLYIRAHNTEEPKRHHDLSFQIFEASIKLIAAPLVMVYLKEIQQGQPRVEAVDDQLRQLTKPSMGHWLGMVREIARHFGSISKAASHPLGHLWVQLSKARSEDRPLLRLYCRIKNGVDGLPAKSATYTLLDVLASLVQYRNQVFGHGGTRSSEFYGNAMGPLLFSAGDEFLTLQNLDMLGPSGTRLVYLSEIRKSNPDRFEVSLFELKGVKSIRVSPMTLSRAKADPLCPNVVAIHFPNEEAPLSLDPLLRVIERNDNFDLHFLNHNENEDIVEYLSYDSGKTERGTAVVEGIGTLLDRLGISKGQTRGSLVAAHEPAANSVIDAPPPLERIYGRDEQFHEFGQMLKSCSGIGVIGMSGIGKTSFVCAFARNHFSADERLDHCLCHFDCKSRDMRSDGASDYLVRAIAEFLEFIGSAHSKRLIRDPQKPAEECWGALAGALAEGKYLVFLDHFEEALGTDGTIVDRRLAALLDYLLAHQIGQSRLVVAVNRNWILPDRLRRYELRPLDAAGSEKLLRHLDETDEKLISRVITIAAGHPFALKLLSTLSQESGLSKEEWGLELARPNSGYTWEQIRRRILDKLFSQHYRSLPAEAQILLRRSAVLRCPVSAAGLQRVSSLSDAEFPKARQLLRGRYLLHSSGLSHHSQHTLVQEFAIRELEKDQDELKAAHRRAGDFFLELAHEQTKGVNDVHILAWDAPRRDHWVLAARLAIQHYLDAKAYDQLAAINDEVNRVLYLIDLNAGYMARCRALCKDIGSAMSKGGDTRQRTEWLHHWAVILHETGELEESQKACREGIHLTEQVEALALFRGHFLHRLAMIRQDLGDFKGAKQNLSEALRAKRGYQLEETSTRSQTAEILAQEGRIEEALAVHCDGIVVAETAVETLLSRGVLSAHDQYLYFDDFIHFLSLSLRIARIERRRGRYAEADIRCSKGISVGRRCWAVRCWVPLLVEEGLAALGNHDAASAQLCLTECQVKLTDLEMQLGTADGVQNPGEQAASVLFTSVQTLGSSEGLYHLGMLHHYLGNPAAAMKWYAQALQLKCVWVSCDCAVRLGIAALQMGNQQAAQDCFRNAEGFCAKVLANNPPPYSAIYSKALLELARGDVAGALKRYKEALTACHAKGVIDFALLDLHLLNGHVDPAAITACDNVLQGR